MANEHLNNGTAWNESYIFNSAGTRSYTFLIENSYSDKNINLNLTVPSASPSFSGGTISGSTSATGTNCSISNSSNNSGVSITTAGVATRSAVKYSNAINGWVNKNSNDEAYAASEETLLANNIYYINGVTINIPTNGTNIFTVTVPKGEQEDPLIVTFIVDSNGNVTIEGSGNTNELAGFRRASEVSF